MQSSWHLNSVYSVHINLVLVSERVLDLKDGDMVIVELSISMVLDTCERVGQGLGRW